MNTLFFQMLGSEFWCHCWHFRCSPTLYPSPSLQQFLRCSQGSLLAQPSHLFSDSCSGLPVVGPTARSQHSSRGVLLHVTQIPLLQCTALSGVGQQCSQGKSQRFAFCKALCDQIPWHLSDTTLFLAITLLLALDYPKATPPSDLCSYCLLLLLSLLSQRTSGPWCLLFRLPEVVFPRCLRDWLSCLLWVFSKMSFSQGGLSL